jgi:hypothetical protein
MLFPLVLCGCQVMKENILLGPCWWQPIMDMCMKTHLELNPSGLMSFEKATGKQRQAWEMSAQSCSSLHVTHTLFHVTLSSPHMAGGGWRSAQLGTGPFQSPRWNTWYQDVYTGLELIHTHTGSTTTHPEVCLKFSVSINWPRIEPRRSSSILNPLLQKRSSRKNAEYPQLKYHHSKSLEIHTSWKVLAQKSEYGITWLELPLIWWMFSHWLTRKVEKRRDDRGAGQEERTSSFNIRIW